MSDSTTDFPSLHEAATSSAESLALLIEAGTDLNARNSSGETALHRAALLGRLDTARILLAHAPGLLNEQTQSGSKTALHVAAEGGHAPMVWLLLEAGAKPNMQNHAGRTPLHSAAFEDHQDIIAILLARGAELDALDHLDCTPLYVAAWKGRHGAAAQLLERGADPWLIGNERVGIYDKEPYSPLEIAKHRHHFRVVRLLTEAGTGPPQPRQELAKKLVKLLEPDLVEVVRRLLPGTTDGELDEAAALLRAREDLLIALTDKEIERLTESATESTRALTSEIYTRRKHARHDSLVCARCGRQTMYAGDREVLHGNPDTPASDTDVVWRLRCASCGFGESKYV